MGRKKTGRLASVRVDFALAHKAKIIAASKGISMAEYITELIRPTVTKEWVVVVKNVEGGEKPK
jgi:hypothetical protein